MGALLQDGGCSYRVWAPFAEQVSVWGDFFHAGNDEPVDWLEVPMARDAANGDGASYWSAFVPGAKADSLYKFFITCHGTQPDTHQQEKWKHDPYARDAVSTAGNSVVVDRDFDWSGDNFRMPPWNELVIYELHIGTFNKHPGTGVGTFDQAIEKLDYLARLGVNAIEVMPAFDFDTVTSMGYNTALPFAIDNAYGETHTFKAFIKAAHQRGMAVLLDVVYNHFGPEGLEHGLGRIDGWWKEPDKWGIYFYPDIRAYTAFGERPDFGRPEVRRFIRDNAMTCLEEFRLDGLRLDSTINIRRAIGRFGDNGELPDGWTLLRWLGEEKRASQPWKILIAEDLQNDDSITRHALEGGVGLDAQWDNWFLGRVRDAMLAPDDEERAVAPLVEAISQSYSSAGPFQRVIYTESHDEAKQQRLTDAIAPGDADGWRARKLSTLGAALAFTSPGIPMIFMGQEFLEHRRWTDARDDVPLDWGRVESSGGMLELYRRLIHLRRNRDRNSRGLGGPNTRVFHVNPEAGVLAFHRWDRGGPGDDVLVVVNLKNRRYDAYNIGLPRDGTWYLRFNSDWTGYWSDYGNAGYDTTAQAGGTHGMPFSGDVGLGPYSVIILSQ
jgi:1,4-alpha-glucan branching enzyme